MDKCGIGDIIEFDAQDVIIEDHATNISKQNENSEENPIIAESIPELVENFEDQNEMKDLICKQFGLKEMVYKCVIDNGFDIESLVVATESEINDLFPAPLLGTRAKFKFHLNVWRKNLIKSKNVSDACRDWIENNCTPNSSEVCSTLGSSTSSHASFGDETRIVNDITLQDFLRKTEKGQSVLEHYKTKNGLDEINKQLLVSLIVDSYAFRKKVMTMRDIETATNAIHCLFPSERKEFYLHKRGGGLNPTGKLHDKAVNARVKLRGSKRQLIIEDNDQKTSLCDPPIDEKLADVNTEEAEKTISWLTHNKEPWSEVQTKWTAVFQQRSLDIKTDGLNVLTKWPLFRHSLGHTLVEIDYENLKPTNKSKLFQLWPAFVKKIVPILQQQIKHKASLDLLKELQDTDTKNCTFIQESYPSESTIDKSQSIEEIQKRRTEYMRTYMRNFRLRKKRELLEKKLSFQEKLQQQIKTKTSDVNATTSSVSPEEIQQQRTLTTTDGSTNYQKENCTFSQESHPSESTIDKTQSIEKVPKRRAEYMRNFRLRKKRELERMCFFQEKPKPQIKNKASGVHATTSSVSREGTQQEQTVTARSRNDQKETLIIKEEPDSLDHIDLIHKVTSTSSAAGKKLEALIKKRFQDEFEQHSTTLNLKNKASGVHATTSSVLLEEIQQQETPTTTDRSTNYQEENYTFSQESYPSDSTIDKNQSIQEIQKKRLEYMRTYMQNFRLRKKREFEKKLSFQEKLKQQIKTKTSNIHATTSSVSPERIQQQQTLTTTTGRSRNYQKETLIIKEKSDSVNQIDLMHKMTLDSSTTGKKLEALIKKKIQEEFKQHSATLELKNKASDVNATTSTPPLPSKGIQQQQTLSATACSRNSQKGNVIIKYKSNSMELTDFIEKIMTPVMSTAEEIRQNQMAAAEYMRAYRARKKPFIPKKEIGLGKLMIKSTSLTHTGETSDAQSTSTLSSKGTQ